MMKTVNVNQLNVILEEYFGVEDIYVQAVRTSPPKGQFPAVRHEVGVGRICTLEITMDDDKDELQRKT